MQRLKAFPAAVINLVIRLSSFLIAKLKNLALHILKHPLGSIWWCVKMYFALMMFSLFVACSFGAMAQTVPENCSLGTVLPGIGCVTPAPSGKLWVVETSFDKKSFNAKHKDLAQAQLMACGWWLSATANVTTDGFRECIGRSYKYKQCNYEVINGVTQCTYTGAYKTASIPGTEYQTGTEYYCPPDAPEFKLFATLYKPNPTTNLCKKDFDKVNNCFSSPDFQLANQYHFDPVSEGKGQVCVKNDKAENCPWKELPGSNGVFQPDIDNKSACDVTPPPPLSDPADKPKDPEKCVPGGNGMKVCKADPNEKCAVNSTGAMSCPDSCGYFNGEFMCFTEPDIPDDPNKPPKKPVPEPDDNITDPFKKMADMNKQDLKEIQRGVESRLEGFSASMENSMNELAAQGKNAEKAAGVGNKLLNSINQNTADTVKELKKLTGDESNPQPNYEETELGEKNDWQVRNFGTVMKAAADKILEKPMFQAIDGYFDVSFGGTCPTWNVSVWVFEVEINQFCDQSFQAILPLIRNVVILIFSILAFRVAFL